MSTSDDESLHPSSSEDEPTSKPGKDQKPRMVKVKVPKAYLSTARWIPLGINPFVALGEVFTKGLSNTGPPDSE
ncbi:hypothetical protein AX14_010149 [Amanita brunnescens Koide BX004]|nr:hypothetical protein AX14_010149 [Amanita brunnescens Koide BX004]